MGLSIPTYPLAKKYTKDTAEQMGAVKGLNAQVQSIQDNVIRSGKMGTLITYAWYDNNDVRQTLEDFVPYGVDGRDGTPIYNWTSGSNYSVGDLVIYQDKWYQCITANSDTEFTPSKWHKIGSDASGSGALENDLDVTHDAGGITVGTHYAEGTSFEKLFRDMLDPVAYPTLTNPSATLSVEGSKLLETGSSVERLFTLVFNRGSISPAYGTSGYRSGEATGYKLNGGDSQNVGSFTETVTASNRIFVGNVSYAAGEQPKDSTGADYSTPLESGNVDSNTITYEFVDALWSNDTNINTIAKEALVSKSAKQKEFSFPAQTVEHPEVFDVPASWTITAVEVKNDLSGQYENCINEFTVTDTTHNDASGTSVAYKRYTDNRGYNAGARKIRIKWS